MRSVRSLAAIFVSMAMLNEWQDFLRSFLFAALSFWTIYMFVSMFVWSI